MTYSEIAARVYGTKCEWAGCGWDEAGCDVHHIDYQEHQNIENALRAGVSITYPEKFGVLIDGQLPKNDSSDNLTVLCPNHHRYVHHTDLGLEVLKYIPDRRKVDPVMLKVFRKKKS